MKEIKREHQTDRKWVFRFALFCALIFSVPYLIAFAMQNPDWVFTGFLIGVEDGNSYIAKMLSGANGAWLFRTPYTTFPQDGLLFTFLPYLLMGKLAGGQEMHLQLVILFHVFRLIAVAALVFSVYEFIRVFEHRRVFRRLGTVVVIFGGGWGWLLFVFGLENWQGSLPLDFYSPETFGFLAAFGFPHLVAGRALMLIGFVFLIRQPDPGPGDGAKAGVAWFFAGLFNPLSPALGWLIAGIYFFFRIAGHIRRSRAAAFRGTYPYLAAVFTSAPVVIVTAYSALADPFFKLWTAQNLILSPHWSHYLIAYGLYLPFALAGIRQVIALKRPVDLLPVIWVLLLPILIALPVNLQRRLAEGGFVALIVLVLRGLRFERRSWKNAVLVVLTLPSTLIILAGSILTGTRLSEPVFRPASEIAAFNYLASNSDIHAVVLAPLSSANALPAWAPVRVVIGHGPESVGFRGLQPQLDLFYANEMSDTETSEFLNSHAVDYIFGATGQTPREGGYSLIYQNDFYEIFSVVND